MGKIKKKLFGKLSNGRIVTAFTFHEGKSEVTILDYGGIIQSIKVPDKNGNIKDVVLGYDNIEGYINNGGYLGAIIGRVANRIDKGKIFIDGINYQLYINDKSNHLHGGKEGFDKKIWNSEIDGDCLVLTYTSIDGEEHYPGNLRVKVVYTFKNGKLRIEYTAVSDKKTVINLTNHSYFNLSGENDYCSILNHELVIDASMIATTDSESIPHGEFRKTENSPFDFSCYKVIRDGDILRNNDKDLKVGGGYDNCFVFDKNRDKHNPFAFVFSPESGILMKCYTDLPSVQFYAGNYLDQKGKGGNYYGRCAGLCLETQYIPNNVNVPTLAEWGSSILDAGDVYHSITEFEFTLRK